MKTLIYIIYYPTMYLFHSGSISHLEKAGWKWLIYIHLVSDKFVVQKKLIRIISGLLKFYMGKYIIMCDFLLTQHICCTRLLESLTGII